MLISNPPGASPPVAVVVRTLCRRLSSEYGNPRHGNKRNPLDELVYIILSNRTREEVYKRTYCDLKRAFPSWRSLSGKDRQLMERLLAPGGLAKLKAGQILAIVRHLREAFGRATLAPLRTFPDDDAERFLTSLPGVGKKVAKCVMMYSLDRPVLPVDVNVHRVASRIGLQTKKRPDTSQDLIEKAIPPTLRYGFHVNAVEHGRMVCLPRSPRCSECCIRHYCRYFRRHTASEEGNSIE